MTGGNDRNDTGSRIHPSRRRLLATTGAVCGGLLAGCLGDESGASGDGSSDDASSETSGADEEMDGTSDGMADSSTEMESGGDASSLPAWQTTELQTVRGDEQFSIEGLDGPVAIQSFAVWCPKCERQSGTLREVADSVTVVGLNTDPNEDAAKVRDHAESNDFDWRFAVAPTELTESLVEEFGTTVTNAPSTPVVVACDSGASTLMSGRVHTADEVETAADDC